MLINLLGMVDEQIAKDPRNIKDIMAKALNEFYGNESLHFELIRIVEQNSEAIES